MKRTLLFITCMLAALTMSAQERLAVGDVQKNSHLSETRGEEVNPMDSLYGKWLLMGWNDGGTWFEVDKKKVLDYCMSIEFNDNGHVTAHSMANTIYFGQLTLKGNELHFEGDGVWSTMVYNDEMENIFFEEHIICIKSYRLDGKQLRLYYTDNDYLVFTKDHNDNEEQSEYRPFVEDGKVWVVRGRGFSYEPWIDYCYFDGDTIVSGQTCKRMMCVENANEENWVDGVFTPADCPRYYIGAWYEQDKKVYFAENGHNQFELLYDFTLSTLDTMPSPDGGFWVVYKLTGLFPGFKGTYYSFGQEHWYEGVGSDSWPYVNDPGYRKYYVDGDVVGNLLACIVGDEFIYYNSEEGNPYISGARKQRIDFTHTTKIKPKTRTNEEAEVSLYGEYSEKQLSINLNPINDAYMVSITDDSGKVVYEKPINAGNIVGLNIDISTYPKGLYTVTVDNRNESFTGEFKAQTSGIEEVRSKKPEVRGYIYNLQGQRLSSLQKGLNIVNGQKIYVK